MTEWFELHTPHESPLELTPVQEQLLVGLVDFLIPATESSPAGSAVLVDRGRLHDALSVRPELSVPLAAVLGFVAETSTTQSIEIVANQLAVALPGPFDDFGRLIAGAYLMDHTVTRAIGYPGQEARNFVDDTDEYLDMLMSVADRGPLYRPTPSNG